MHNKCIWYKIKNKSERIFCEKYASLSIPISAPAFPMARELQGPRFLVCLRRTRRDKHSHVNGSTLETVRQLTFSMTQLSPVRLPGTRP